MTDQTQTVEIARLIEPSVEDAGFDLVRVHFLGGDGQTLQVMAERKDRKQMTVDDCAEISRMVSALLDVEDPVSGAYSLEVSSPGIERPLVRLGDYDRFAGFEAKIEMARPLSGRRRFRGRLEGTRDETVLISVDDGAGTLTVKVPFGDIRRAALEFTDEPIDAAMNQGN